MKKIIHIISILAITSIGFFSCKEEVDVEGLLDFAPAIQSVTPKNSSNIVLGNFDLKVVAVDGARSPLASGTLKLKDADGNEIVAFTKALGGTKDSVVVEGTSFDAASLTEGTYKLEVVLKDSHDQETAETITFKILNSLYPSNQPAMYIAGSFNGWGSGEMELVADYTWEIKEIDLQGGEWKLKNTEDWSDQDWGDADCDGKMEVTTGGGPNTNCNYKGLVNVRFNDETLVYTVMPAVNYAANVSALYLLGTFNSFEGDMYAFTQVADNTWALDEVRLKPNDAFKFAEGPNFEPKNFGDAEGDGIAEEFGPNIKMATDAEDAFYKITFNDATLAYSIELVRYPYPGQLFLVGGSTVADWTPGDAVPFVATGEGTFEIYSYITAGGGGFKFLQVKDWAGDWGKGAEGELIQEGESNVEVSADGFYRIVTDFTNRTYEVQAMSWGLIGDATPGGWNADTDMTFGGGKGDYTWTITVDLIAGPLKFRANDAWDVNLGDSGADGSLNYGGDNIAIAEAGNYTIGLVLDPALEAYTYTVTKN